MKSETTSGHKLTVLTGYARSRAALSPAVVGFFVKVASVVCESECFNMEVRKTPAFFILLLLPLISITTDVDAFRGGKLVNVC